MVNGGISGSGNGKANGGCGPGDSVGSEGFWCDSSNNVMVAVMGCGKNIDYGDVVVVVVSDR